MWKDRLLVAGVVVFLAAALVYGRLSSSHRAPPPGSAGPATGTDAFLGEQRCGGGDLAIAIGIRRPTRAQEFSEYRVQSRHPVATVILRNVGDRRCLGGSPFTFTIRARDGTTVGRWNSSWLADSYLRDGYRTFSLPAVYTCDRPGPFTAVAVVGGQTARRGGLGRSAITCS